MLAADPRHLQQAYNFSEGTVRGPWNEGEMKDLGKDFVYIESPVDYIKQTAGMTNLPDDYSKELKATEKLNKEMSEIKSAEVKNVEPKGVAQWSIYDSEGIKS